MQARVMVLQKNAAHLDEIKRRVRQLLGQGSAVNYVTYTTDQLEVQSDVSTLSGSRRKLVVISGLLYAGSLYGPELARSIKRMAPQALFLFLTEHDLMDDMTQDVDGVIHRPAEDPYGPVSSLLTTPVRSADLEDLRKRIPGGIWLPWEIRHRLRSAAR